jgi:hypothetical protein
LQSIVSLCLPRHRYCMKRSRDALRCTTRSVNTMSVPTVLLSHLSRQCCAVGRCFCTGPLHGSPGSFCLSSRMMSNWRRGGYSCQPKRSWRAVTWQRRSGLSACDTKASFRKQTVRCLCFTTRCLVMLDSPGPLWAVLFRVAHGCTTKLRGIPWGTRTGNSR